MSAGATGSFHCACLALLNPGDEVIVFEPYYGYHMSAILAVEAVPRVMRMHAPDWVFTQADLAQVISSRTKAIVVNTPGNPSGKVFTRQELEWIAQFAQDHDLFVLTDEIYEYFLFDGRRHISLASLPGMRDRTITIGGYSKTFSITGWRIGYSVASPQWAQLIGAMNDLLYVCAPAPLQFGVAVGVQELPPSFYTDLAREYEQKRDQFCRSLRKPDSCHLFPRGPITFSRMLPGFRVQPGKIGQCIFSIKLVWPGCRVRPSFPGRMDTGISVFVLQKLIMTCSKLAGGWNSFPLRICASEFPYNTMQSVSERPRAICPGGLQACS